MRHAFLVTLLFILTWMVITLFVKIQIPELSWIFVFLPLILIAGIVSVILIFILFVLVLIIILSIVDDIDDVDDYWGH
jgi:ABC-type Na+ efflux pump permease subunit